MFTQRTLWLLVAIVSIVAAACGSDDDSTATASTAPEPTVAETVTSAPPPPPDDTGATVGQDRSAEVVGRWEVTNYVLPDGGGLTNVVGEELVFIEFGTDGTVRYHTGCNGGGTDFSTSGTYAVPESALDDTVEGQAITIGPAFEQTEIGCDGFLGDQDLDLPANMGAATRFILDGDRLLLLDDFILIETTRAE